MTDHVRTDLVIAALLMAIQRRQPTAGFIQPDH
jgi:hypothetical protein